MPIFNQKQIEEISVIIKAIEVVVKPGMEIGARDRTTLAGLLLANKIEKKPKFFGCKREYPDEILNISPKKRGYQRTTSA